MKSSGLNIYNFIGKSLLSAFIFLTLISCSNYRYVTQNYNATIIIDSVQAAKIDTDYKIEKDSNGIHIVQTYSKDSILISIERYIDYKNSIHTDESRFWYPDGNLKKTINYNKVGKKEQKLITYHNNGQIKREDLYKNGKLITGKCYDSLGNEVKYFPYETEPIVDLNQISNCFKYPENLRRQDIEERLIAKILVDKKGKIIKIKYDDLHSPEFVNEAVLCILKSNIQPAYEDGEPILCWVSIPIMFRIS